MSIDDNPMRAMANKLGQRVNLLPADVAAILALPHSVRTLSPLGYVVREGEISKGSCQFILEGFAFRQKLTVAGGRQIVSLHMQGDILDLQNMFLSVSDHSVQALTRLTIIEIAKERLQNLILTHPAIGAAMWIDGLIDGSIYREWVLNVGRRDARARIAHILCEFVTRMEATGVAESGTYPLPMTQEQLGDAVGLTSVHVNRTLRALVKEGLVKFDRRQLSILDWDGIRAVGEFSPLYLHLDQHA